ncbi:HDIG domain-containing metalloprotein [Methanolapillus ohkumae]|uniref:Ribonuclease Y n=1 Tax=Methanolapillus ohkumae TaxID=3028298 RepID=A0AA96ZVI0_9EURY|nr:Ribonuclease Y [Methanosarcinaceae archaeon Am2]
MISREKALQILKEEGCEEKVIAHCCVVSEVAVCLARKNIEAGRDVNVEFVEIGGLLHDLGRARSHGMDHAVIGAELAQKYNLDDAILKIIKKHIGAGLTPEEANYFGLPADDYMPRTWEEKIVAHADNIVKGDEVISLKKRLKILKERGVDKESRKRVKELAHEVDFETSDEMDDRIKDKSPVFIKK